MLCKYYLQLGCYAIDTDNPECMDVSSMIKNLDSIKVSYARVDLGGVVRKCGSSLEFTGKAYDAIIAHYEKHYLQSKGVFAVYMADNNWNYSKVWECPLDFATLQYDANVVTIGCVDNSAAAIIKANKKSKYEFNVADLKDDCDLRYNGVTEKQSFRFYITGASDTGTIMKSTGNVGNPEAVYFTRDRDKYSVYFPSITATAVQADLDNFTLQTQEEYSAIHLATGRSSAASCLDSTKPGFIRCNRAGTIHLEINMSFWFKDMSKLEDYNVEFVLWNLYRTSRGVGGTYTVLGTLTESGVVELNVVKEVQMYENRELAFGVILTTKRNTENSFDLGMRWDSNENNGYAEKNNEIENPIDLNIVKPATLLNSLIEKMFADSDNHCVTRIEEDKAGVFPRTLLLAAESVRQISTNKIYSSFTDFCKFMEVVFGYVYTLTDVGYYMDSELEAYDRGDRNDISHIKMENITSETMNPASTKGYYRMLPVGGFIDEDFGEAIDFTTAFNYYMPAGTTYNSYLENILYDSIHNVFVVWDATTQKYYANFRMVDAIMQGSWYNENGHAKEMIGLNIATFNEESGEHQYGIIRNGAIVLCDEYHTLDWLDLPENNKNCTELAFKHRSSVFNSGIIKSIATVNNLSYQVDDSLAYSDIEVGYAKKDYDNSNNAKSEFNFMNYYKTNCNISEQTLSLICPYRADCYGTQELINKNADSESTESDDDVFIVIATSANPVGDKWEIDRSLTITGVFSPETMFNAAIAPHRIVRNNEEYIGSCVNTENPTNIIKFTSSDGNSGAYIDGVRMSANLNITKQLFKVGKISIDTDDHRFPGNWEGVIEFAYAGKTYKGYLDSIDICFANMGTITYNLIEKCIE